MKHYTIMVVLGIAWLFNSCSSSKNNTNEGAELSENPKNVVEEITIESKYITEAPKAQLGAYLPSSLYLKIVDTEKTVLPDFSESKGQLGEYPLLQNLIEEFGIKTIKSAFANLNQKTYRIDIQDDQNLDSLILKLSSLSFVEYAEKIPLNK